MFDPASITAAVHSLRALIDLAKGMNNAQISGEVVSAVIEIQTKLLNVQEQALELQDENRRLQAEVDSLKANARVLYEGNARWEHLPDGTVNGPLCDACWGLNGKCVHMEQSQRRLHNDYVVYECFHHPNIAVSSDVPKVILEKYRIAWMYR